jgi:cytochrome bd-type quinol oxidase subunit 2
MQSQLATSLEHQQQGEQFRVLDPPSLPEKPSSPNHVYFSLGGLMAGLCLGLCLTAVLEMIDVRVRQEKDLEGIVPGEENLRVMRKWTELGAAFLLAMILVVGNLYAFYKG